MGTEGTYRQVDFDSLERKRAERQLAEDAFHFWWGPTLAWTQIMFATANYFMTPVSSQEKTADVVPISPLAPYFGKRNRET